MDIEFHYYITKYLAKEAGFDNNEAEIIAYSSQYVDDNTTQYNIQINTNESYQNLISQTPDITKPIRKNIRIYVLHHYLPGDPNSPKARRKDGKMHLLMTTAASTHAQEIFFEATRSEDLFKLGIASHMLSDTYMHQNFVGNYDEINSMKGVWDTLKPFIGHADASYKPDIPNLIWEDPRLIDENGIINNPERIMQAARKLYNNFIIMTSFESNWPQIKQNLSEILKNTISEKQLRSATKLREERISAYLEILNDKPSNKYDPHRWFEIAVSEKSTSNTKSKQKIYSFKKNYQTSNWYLFQEAVKEYQNIAFRKLKPILEDLDLKEW